MAERFEPLLNPPIAFADGGSSVIERAETLPAFELAFRLGATGIECTARLTADGVAVVSREGSVRRGLRRQAIGTLAAADLPPHIPTVDQVLALSENLVHWSLAPGDLAAVEPLLEAVGSSPMGTRPELWLRCADWDALLECRRRWPELRLIDNTRLASMTSGPERRAASLASAGVEAVRLPYADWTAGLVTLFHRFEVLAFSWDAIHERMVDDLLRMGIDAVSSPHVDRLVDSLARVPR